MHSSARSTDEYTTWLRDRLASRVDADTFPDLAYAAWHHTYARQCPDDAYVERVRRARADGRRPAASPLDAPRTMHLLGTLGGRVAGLEAAATVGGRLAYAAAELARVRPALLGATAACRLAWLDRVAEGAAGAPLPAPPIDLAREDGTMPTAVLATLVGRGQVALRLGEVGGDPAARDLLGHSAAHWAAATGQVSLMYRLLGAGCAASDESHLFAAVSDFLPTFGPERPDIAEVEGRGGRRRWLGQEALRREVGFRREEHSALTVDFLVGLALCAAHPGVAAPLLRALPLEPLPAPAAPRLTLRHFPDLGWGVTSDLPLREGTFLGSYAGALTPADEDAIAMAFGDEGDYVQLLHDIYAGDPAHTAPLRRLAQSLDAADGGGLVSRINSVHEDGHENVDIRGGWRRGRPVVDFYTARPTLAGEQLATYYGPGFWAHRQVRPRPLTRAHRFFGDRFGRRSGHQTLATLIDAFRAPAMPLHIIDLAACPSIRSLVGRAGRPGRLSLAYEGALGGTGAYPLVCLTHFGRASRDVQRLITRAFSGAAQSYFDAFLRQVVETRRGKVMFVYVQASELPAAILEEGRA